MDGYGARLALVLLLVAVNAVLSGTEMALVSLREGQLRRLAQRSPAGRALVRLSRDPNRFLATIQLGITLAGFLASAAAAVSLAEPLVGLLGFLGAAARPAAVIGVTVLLTFVTLVLGELAPKRLAMQCAERWGLFAARPLELLARLARPAVWLLSVTTDGVVRLVGGNPHAQREEATEEELRELLASQRSLSPQQREIVSGAFEIADRTLREILVPRSEVTALPGRLPGAAAMHRLAGAGRSRAPVTGPGGLDDVLGVVHIRDLVDADSPVAVAERARPALFLPETLRVADAIRELRQRHEQFALVVDERGGTAGLITMEDLLEEVVGELYDETDRDVREVVRAADGSLLVPGGFPLHDLSDIGVELGFPLPREYTTLAGLLLSRLGHLPSGPGERVDLPGFSAEVVRVERHAIVQVRLRVVTSHPDGGSAGG